MTGYKEILDKLEEENRLRVIPADRNCNRDNLLDLCSNDYMGLAYHESEIRTEFNTRFPNASFSASASRLLSLCQRHHLDLEKILEDLYGRAALIYNSGYHANTGITAALNIPGTLFVSDKLIHASMIDGLRCGRCEMRRFRHNDMRALRAILEKESSLYARIIVMVESIYSMDGDTAPLAELVALKKEFQNVILYVDEAHGFGVRGKRGLGLSEEMGLLNEIDILVGTLGKAALSVGAFSITTDSMKKYLLNTARSFIFSTALPPANIAWSILTISRLVEMNAERNHLIQISKYFRRKLIDTGFDVPECDTPIVPLVTGDATKAISLSSQLRENGILALPIRRPTVPPGGERIRFSLNAHLTESEIDKVVDTLMIISKL